MEVQFSPELEAKLNQSAARQGRRPDELVQQLVERQLDEDARFIEAVRIGDEALARGEYVTHEEVGKLLEPYLRP